MKLISNVTNNFIYLNREAAEKSDPRKTPPLSVTETESVATEIRSQDKVKEKAPVLQTKKLNDQIKQDRKY